MTIYSFNDFRTILRQKLEQNPFCSLSSDELCNIIDGKYHDIVSKCDLDHLIRLKFWLSREDIDSKIINMNTEAPRFGILAEHKDQESYGMANHKDLKEFLDVHTCDYEKRNHIAMKH